MSISPVPVLVASAAGVLALTACASLDDGRFRDEERLTGPLTSVLASGGSGSVTVQRTPGASAVTVSRTVHYRGDEPTGRWDRLDGTVLRLDGRCGADCWVDYVVTVPDAVDVSAALGSGDVALTGVGRVQVSTGSGDIRISAATGSVAADAGSGDVTLADLRSTVTANAGSGDVRVDAAGGSVTTHSGSGDTRIRTSTAVDVRARTSSGDLVVTVPSGSGYRVEADSGSGDANVSVASVAGAAHRLDLATGSGDLTATAG